MDYKDIFGLFMKMMKRYRLHYHRYSIHKYTYRIMKIRTLLKKRFDWGNKSKFIAFHSTPQTSRHCNLRRLKYNKLNLHKKTEPEIPVGFLAQLLICTFQDYVNRKIVLMIILTVRQLWTQLTLSHFERLFGAEQSVTSISQSRQDVAVFVQSFIQRSCIDIHIRISCVQGFHAFRSSNQTDELHG